MSKTEQLVRLFREYDNLRDSEIAFRDDHPNRDAWDDTEREEYSDLVTSITEKYKELDLLCCTVLKEDIITTVKNDCITGVLEEIMPTLEETARRYGCGNSDKCGTPNCPHGWKCQAGKLYDAITRIKQCMGVPK